jgi:hypothetical protein
MLAYEEYLAPARPSEALEALRSIVVTKGWTIEEDHSDRFFCLEAGTPVRLEPRKLEVSAEDYRLESKVRLVIWCSGFSLRRYDGKVDFVKALPYECTRLNGRGAASRPVSEPVPLGATADGEGRPSWVTQIRFGEFGLVGFSLALLFFFVMGVTYHLPRWAVAGAVVLAALASLGSGLVLDFLTRRALKIASRSGMKAQLRRAGISAAIAAILLLWLWRM